MGCLCPTITQRPQPVLPAAAVAAQPVTIAALPDSDRLIVRMEQRKERGEQFEKTIRRRDSALGNVSLGTTGGNSNISRADPFSQIKNSVCNNKNFSRLTTVLTGSSRLERTVSYLGEPEAINSFLTVNSNDSRQQVLILTDNMLPQQSIVKLNSTFYSLILQKAYVKKHARQAVKVRSPLGHHSLHCQPQLIRQTIFLTQGLPIDNILLLQNGSYINSPTYDLQISLTVRCMRCGAFKKHDYAVALIELNFVCECGCNDFQFVELNSRIPLWVNGRRVNQGLPRYTRGGFVRGMGCTDCWRFKGCRVMACGCWKCGECSKNSGENCLLCTS